MPSPMACGRWSLPVIIIFGLKFGVFTPTEAAVVCAVYALFVAMVVYRELKWKDLYRVFATAAQTTAVVMFLVAAAMVSAWLITIAELPGQVIALLEPFIGNKILLMIAMMALVVVVGTALDMLPTILILTPVLMPIVKQGRHRSDLLRCPVHHQQRDRAADAAGRHGLERRMRRHQSAHGRYHQGRLAFHDRAAADPALLILFPPLVTVPAKWFNR